MSDVAAMVMFAGLVGATVGLVQMCEWLRPRETQAGEAETGKGMVRQEGRA